MSRLRNEVLEDWDMLFNPVRVLRDAVDQLKQALDELAVDPASDGVEDPAGPATYAGFLESWNQRAPKYLRAFGLALALRALAPVLGEAFVNLLLFILCKPELRKNERLYQAAVRANLDVRAQSLHLNCVGFSKAVDWSAQECRRFHSVVNDRNDLLHGNVVPEKLKVSEIYFLGRVPVFKEYRGFWQQSIAQGIDAFGLRRVNSDLDAVQEFMTYVLSCLSDQTRTQVNVFLARKDFGLKKGDGRLGILLPDHVVDIQMSPFSSASPPVSDPNHPV